MYKVLVSNKVNHNYELVFLFYVHLLIRSETVWVEHCLKKKKKKKKKKRTRGTSVHKQISLPSSHSSLSKENFSNISMQQIFLLWVSDMKGYIFLTIKEMSSTL